MSQAATDSGVTKVSNLETKFFAHPYSSEILPQRVSRLEKFVYGIESKDALETRINRLSASMTNVPNKAAVSSKTTFSSKEIASAKNAASTEGVAKSTASSKANNDVAASATKYPRITELEQQVLDKTFVSEPVAERIARLEEKVFGRVWSNQTDLATRVDRLAEYAFMSPKIEELERLERQRVSMVRDAVYDQSQQMQSVRASHQVQIAQFHMGSMFQPKKVMLTVVDEIESLETMAYGKISASKPLAQRVDALEVTLCGASQTDKQQNITSRVAVLLAKVNSSLPNRFGV